MEDKLSQVKKVVVKSDDELTDIVSQIDSTEAENILLTFSEPSDLLVSPVNLKVIQESADALEKSLIFQIIDNPAGVRNATEIGSVYTDTTKPIDEDMWSMAYNDMKNRNKEVSDALKRTSGVAAGVAAGAAVKKAVDKSEKDDDDRKYVTDDIGEYQDEAKDIEVVSPDEKSEFQERVDSALEKSKRDIEASKGGTVEEGGLMIGLEHDIKEDVAKGAIAGTVAAGAVKDKEGGETFTKGEGKKSAKDLTGKSFKAFEEKKVEVVSEDDFKKDAPQAASVVSMGKSIIPKKIPDKLKSKKLWAFIVVPLLLITALLLLYIYRYTPLVKIKMYIESRPVTAEQTFTGDPTVTEFSLEDGKVPVKRETVNKERSDSTNATGTATRGEKASGLVRFVCGPVDEPDKVIPAGTRLTSGEGLVFVLVSDVAFTCPSITFPTGTAEAAEFGAEYNISSGVLLTVAGEPDVAATTETSFTGGSKEEYTVVSRQDYDRVVNPLKESAFKEAESELKDKETDGWVIVPGTVKSELNGNVETDVPIGAEADVLNVTVKTKSTALYYKRAEIDAVMEEMLLNSATENNLFETEGDLELELSKDITSEIKVVKVEGDKVTLLVTVNGEVKPNVDKEEIVEDLKGLSWEEGNKYLDSLTFVAQPTEVTFEPDYFPDGLRYFPSAQGRILLTIVEVEPEVEEPEAPAEAE